MDRAISQACRWLTNTGVWPALWCSRSGHCTRAWARNYVKYVTTDRDSVFIDHVWLTHYYGDHLGHVEPDSPLSEAGYHLTGLTGVLDGIPFGRIVDRSYPEYDYPLPRQDDDGPRGRPGFGNSRATEDNYHAFVWWHRTHRGIDVERFVPGRLNQLGMRHEVEAFPTFQVRNVCGNGLVWSGEGEGTLDTFPDPSTLNRESVPNENSCSCGALLEYGPFRYFTGGDITGIVELDRPDWYDVESPVARAVGAVDVAVLNHHGHRDTHNEFYVSTLRPRVWIGHSWCADHPGQGVLTRLMSQHLYPGPRDLFATNMLVSNRHVIGPLIDRAYRSTQGHIIVRVDPGGTSYRVVIVDEATLNVLSIHGPYGAPYTRPLPAT